MKFIKAILSLISLTLVSCSVSKEHSIYVINNFEIATNNETPYQWINLSANEVATMIETKQTFPLAIYSKSCSYCEKFEQVLKKYNSEYKQMFYRYESNSSSNQLLKEQYPDIFKDNLSTPGLLLIKEGELTYSYNNNKLTSNSAFKGICKAHLLSSNVTTIFTLESFEKYKQDNSFLCYIYNGNNLEALNYLSSEIFTIAFQSKLNTLIINNNITNFIDIDEYSLASDSSIIIFENGQLKSAANYEDGSANLNSLITSYYN